MSNKRLFNWCQSVLPTNFQQVKNQTTKIQQFFAAHLPDAISRHIHVMNISDDEIVVAVDDSQIANYLRLHHREIQQQLLETFNLKKSIKFKTLPASLLQTNRPEPYRHPNQVSSETITGIERSADWIEDEELHQALLSLAERLKPKT